MWSVAFTPRGELVSGCSDAVGRVWSNDPTRQVRGRARGRGQQWPAEKLGSLQEWVLSLPLLSLPPSHSCSFLSHTTCLCPSLLVRSNQADAETTAAFNRLLEERKAAAAQAASNSAAAAAAGAGSSSGAAGGWGALPPGVKVADAVDLIQPGSKDGETKLVREGDGSVAAYGWSLSAGTWEKIGTVVEAPQAGAWGALGHRRATCTGQVPNGGCVQYPLGRVLWVHVSLAAVFICSSEIRGGCWITGCTVG